jgi:UDP-N-acetylglucosamine 2-epimerase (non-hydrolysing)
VDVRKFLFVFGTRPEAIKLAPLIFQFSKVNGVDMKVCITAQHRHMLDQVLDFFGIVPDFDLNIMKENQTLFDLTSDGLKGMETVLNFYIPDVIFVQGDTTTAFVGALSGFYKKVKVAHVEAGLRSFDKYSPFPEEMNRVIISRLSDFHFAPTEKARENLVNEGIRDNVYVVGNTVIDALFLGISIIERNSDLKSEIESYFSRILKGKESKVILITGHRRESFGKPFEDICLAIREIASKFKDVELIYPVHLNPNVREPVNRILGNVENVHLIDPVPYPYMIWLMKRSYLVLTDSGGIQEEAPSLGKPVLVMRNVTERTEGLEAGTSKLVGTSKERIVHEVEKLLMDEGEYQKMARAVNPYGDGRSSERIVDIMLEQLE